MGLSRFVATAKTARSKVIFLPAANLAMMAQLGVKGEGSGKAEEEADDGFEHAATAKAVENI